METNWCADSGEAAVVQHTPKRTPERRRVREIIIVVVVGCLLVVLVVGLEGVVQGVVGGSLFLVGVLPRMAQSTGLVATAGVLTGEKMDSSN